MNNILNLLENNNIKLIVLVTIILIFGWFLRKIYKILLFFYIKLRGKLGEKKAINLLKNHGYQIIDQQITLKGSLLNNNVPQYYFIRPDYLVKKDNEFYIAEVKTGKSASIQNISTRRQLLEYTKVYNSKKIILIDVKEKTVNLIEFT
ncbi:MAG: hypothetical protein CFH34_01077 [Alphaproteobacteria bacterium MarineAlpha9_Bin4]|mgnify:CR=1 FL=1|nr:hypothetical protein [Pelagibacterales bacterium]PPR26233.1 MAG: hypothetical protein CFH34_01077 [Alphaproteobacteria bacterium MarineAlpha9_Bin4]|tara:strand:- start:48 stop:491 length:444 start_codon:yes stop_codon:yes gene_type:complete